MARWRLTENHYLNALDPVTRDKNEWEYNETDRDTGRAIRKRFVVPLFLDIRDPACHTPPKSGQVIVSYEKGALPSDVIFTGEPTPSMEPIDDEATEISRSLENKWKHPIDSMSTTLSQSLISHFEGQINEIMRLKPGQASVPNVAQSQVSADDFAKLQAQVQELAAQNLALQAAAAEKPAEPVRRA